MAQIFSDCTEKFENDKYRFLSLLENNIDLDEFISISFRNHYHASTGRPRKYPLTAMLWALLLQRIFSIPTDALLIIFLQYSKELRDFCGFSKVPDASKFTRFKQDFLQDLQSMFDTTPFQINLIINYFLYSFANGLSINLIHSNMILNFSSSIFLFTKQLFLPNYLL